MSDFGFVLPFYYNVEQKAGKMTGDGFSNPILII